jgi:uncharacterized protein with von Willebrand factor type A (vWA) domain
MAAVEAVEGGWGNTQEQLQDILCLLWCNSLVEQNRLRALWDTIVPTNIQKTPEKQIEKDTKRSSPQKYNYSEKPSFRQEIKPEQFVTSTTQEIAVQPIKSPFIPADIEEERKFTNYWLLSRRQMVYAWRYLRRLVADGPEDVLDVTQTVEQAAQQGFFLQPVYRRREKNHAHLVLLIDQEGSMTPFHRFSRDLVVTAEESDIERVNVGYFHNVPAASVYQDTHLTEPIPLTQILAECDNNTKVLIISDAGAARGYRRMDRVRTITEVLFDIKEYTNLIAWLNPMPRERWDSTSAQIISHLVPMFPMDKEGFSQAINIVQGQFWHSN